MRVIVGLSGGVDSSVAAARLADAGHEVVGVHLAMARASTDGSARGCAVPGAADHVARRPVGGRTPQPETLPLTDRELVCAVVGPEDGGVRRTGQLGPRHESLSSAVGLSGMWGGRADVPLWRTDR